MDIDLNDELTHSPKDPEGNKPGTVPLDLYYEIYELTRNVEMFDERQRVNFVALSDTLECLRQGADHNFHSIHDVWDAVLAIRKMITLVAAMNIAGILLIAGLLAGLDFGVGV